jgi:hypothetical protein
MKISLIHDSTQLYTDTVRAHVETLAEIQPHDVQLLCWREAAAKPPLLRRYEAHIVHYSTRLPYGQLTPEVQFELAKCAGPKVVFLQDEYEFIGRSKSVLKAIGCTHLFTCMPTSSARSFYELESTVKVSRTLTGFLSDADARSLETAIGRGRSDRLPSVDRPFLISYRGRELAPHYGVLGNDKVWLPKAVARYLEQLGLAHNIDTREESRIYGDEWATLLSQSIATLGTESGSNLFDWWGEIRRASEALLRLGLHREQVIQALEPLEKSGLMNQISPRIFEATVAGSALVLLQGEYSGILRPQIDFFELDRALKLLPRLIEGLQQPDIVSEKVRNAQERLLSLPKLRRESLRSGVRAALEAGTTQPSIPTWVDCCPDISVKELRRQLRGPNHDSLGRKFERRRVASATKRLLAKLAP